MQTTLTTSHWRTLQEILLQQMEEKTESQVSVLLAGMPFITQGVQDMLRGASWISRADILAPQDEERFDIGTIDTDVIFLTTPGTSRLLSRIATRYQLRERSAVRVGGGHLRETQAGQGYGATVQHYPGEVVAADISLHAAHRGRRREIAERGAPLETDGRDATPPGLALMHISGAISRDDIALSQLFGRPVSLHLRDGAKTIRTGIFAAAQGLTYCSPNAFAGQPELFGGYSPDPLDPAGLEGLEGTDLRGAGEALPVADLALWQMLSQQNEESPPV